MKFVTKGIIVNRWSETQINISRRITEKGKELMTVTTRDEQYQNIKKYNMRFNYKKQYCWFEKDCGVKQRQKSVDY